jgi:hypothetical protein
MWLQWGTVVNREMDLRVSLKGKKVLDQLLAPQEVFFSIDLVNYFTWE